jgi:hypothetical protein
VRIYSQRDSNGTSGAAAVLLQKDTAMISVANRVIAVGYITISLPCGEQKHNPEAWSRQLSTDQRLRSASQNFLRFVLRSGKILMQNCATLRNALRKRNDELPIGSNDMQSSETLRNSLGLNYKSAALDQVSYTGKNAPELSVESQQRQEGRIHDLMAGTTR